MYVTQQSYEALSTYAAANGVTVAAVVEAIGQALAEGREPNLGTQRFVERARQIASQRRART